MNVGLCAIIRMHTLHILLCTMYKTEVKVNADEFFFSELRDIQHKTSFPD